MIWCGEHDILCHHLNVGQFKLPDGRYFNTGIPKGFPDLQLIGHGWVAYEETKILIIVALSMFFSSLNSAKRSTILGASSFLAIIVLSLFFYLKFIKYFTDFTAS